MRYLILSLILLSGCCEETVKKVDLVADIDGCKMYRVVFDGCHSDIFTTICPNKNKDTTSWEQQEGKTHHPVSVDTVYKE